MDLDRIDQERRGPMVVLERKQRVVLPSAADLPWRVVAEGVNNPHIFATLVWPSDKALTAWKLEIVQRAWTAHNGLPETNQVRRLIYMVERYFNGIEVDFRRHLGISAGQLWRDRRWREMLNYIDNLPTDSQMHRLLTSDEEHMKAILKGHKGGDGPARPSMADWSLTNSLLATLIDSVNRNTAVNQGIAANGKGPKPKFTPYPRPYSAAEKVQRELQVEAHEEMKAILLRGR